MSTNVTITGNLAADPELRFTPSGAAVANFVVLHTERTLNKQTNEWEDGETTRFKCAAWRQMAENVAESLQRGMTVIVQGNLVGKQWTNGEKSGTDLEITVDHVGPSLKFATAKVTRASRSNNGGAQSQQPQNSGAQQGWGQQPQCQPQNQQGWGQQPQGQPQPAGAPAGGGWGTVSEDEPPF